MRCSRFWIRKHTVCLVCCRLLFMLTYAFCIFPMLETGSLVSNCCGPWPSFGMLLITVGWVILGRSNAFRSFFSIHIYHTVITGRFSIQFFRCSCLLFFPFDFMNYWLPHVMEFSSRLLCRNWLHIFLYIASLIILLSLPRPIRPYRTILLAFFYSYFIVSLHIRNRKRSPWLGYL